MAAPNDDWMADLPPLDRRSVHTLRRSGIIRVICAAVFFGVDPSTIAGVMTVAYDLRARFDARRTDGFSDVRVLAVQVNGADWARECVVDPDVRADWHQKHWDWALLEAQQTFPSLPLHARLAVVDDLTLELQRPDSEIEGALMKISRWTSRSAWSELLRFRLLTAKTAYQKWYGFDVDGRLSTGSLDLDLEFGDAALFVDAATDPFGTVLELTTWTNALRSHREGGPALIAQSRAGAQRARVQVVGAAADRVLVSCIADEDQRDAFGSKEGRRQLAWWSLQDVCPSTWGRHYPRAYVPTDAILQTVKNTVDPADPHAAFYYAVASRHRDLNSASGVLAMIIRTVQEHLGDA